MGGWVGGWVGVKAVLRIAYSNQQSTKYLAANFTHLAGKNMVTCTGERCNFPSRFGFNKFSI
jgi:hypothetical protein